MDEPLLPLPGWPEEPPYVPPPRAGRTAGPLVPPEFREGGLPPGTVVQNYYAAPVAPKRRGPDPWALVGWTVAAAMATAVLLAVAMAAVAIAASVCALALAVCVLYLLYRSAVS